MTVPIDHSELQLLQTSPFERVFVSWQVCRGESLLQSLIQCEYTWYQTDGSEGRFDGWFSLGDVINLQIMVYEICQAISLCSAPLGAQLF